MSFKKSVSILEQDFYKKWHKAYAAFMEDRISWENLMRAWDKHIEDGEKYWEWCGRNHQEDLRRYAGVPLTYYHSTTTGD